MALFKRKLTDEEKRVKMLEKCAELLTKYLREDIPATGRFQKRYCTFPLYGTKNDGYAAIEVWLPDPKRRGLQLGALREGTDMLVSHYVCTGTNEELLAYLADPATQKDWQTRIMELSDSVDEHW